MRISHLFRFIVLIIKVLMLFFLLNRCPPARRTGDIHSTSLYSLVLDSFVAPMFKYARVLSAGKDTQISQLEDTMRPKKKKR